MVVEINGKPIRNYVTPVHVEGFDKRQYVRLDVAMESPDIWDQVLERALEEVLLWKRKYEHLKELSSIVKAITKAEKKLSRELADEKETRKPIKTTRTRKGPVDTRPRA